MFEAVDVTKDLKNQPPIIIKFSSHHDDLAKEIRILKLLRKKQKEMHGQKVSGSIPQMTNFGMIVVDDSKSDLDFVEENAKLYGYFVMKKYAQTLEEYSAVREEMDP